MPQFHQHLHLKSSFINIHIYYIHTYITYVGMYARKQKYICLTHHYVQVFVLWLIIRWICRNEHILLTGNSYTKYVNILKYNKKKKCLHSIKWKKEVSVMTKLKKRRRREARAWNNESKSINKNLTICLYIVCTYVCVMYLPIARNIAHTYSILAKIWQKETKKIILTKR